LTRLARLLDGVAPFVAIGGIDLSTLPGVLATGVGSAAVVRAITEAPDTAAAVAALERAFTR
jgi:thiamine-phosphate pyrophosphorylase